MTPELPSHKHNKQSFLNTPKKSTFGMRIGFQRHTDDRPQTSTELESGDTKNIEVATSNTKKKGRSEGKKQGREGGVRTGHPIQHCSCGSHSAGIRNPIFAGRPSRIFAIIPASLSLSRQSI
jgi:hypothetical protein